MLEVFFLGGTLIILGFFAMLFFERTKIPDILILIAAGVFIGPVFGIADTSPGSVITQLAPYVGTLALIVLLFDGGLNLNIFRVVRELPKASSFTIVVFLLTIALSGLVARFLFGWSVLEGVLLGAVLGGTSSSVVIPIIRKTSASEESKTILSLESALTDAMCMIFSITTIEIILAGSLSVRDVANSLAGAFSIAVVVAVFFAVAWVAVLRKFYGRSLGYVLTIAAVFILYSSVETLRGNGAISVLVFGLLLGNFQELSRLVRAKEGFHLDDTIRAFQTEVSFLVRTFFFVYLGLLLNPAAFSTAVIISAAAVLAAIVIARFVGVYSLVRMVPEVSAAKSLLFSMMPRGLASAVLASLPFSMGIVVPHFADIVFVVMVSTNIVATLGIFLYEHGAGKGKIQKNAGNLPT